MITIALKKDTKARLDRWKASGQSYDELLCQILGVWQKHSISYHKYQRRKEV